MNRSLLFFLEIPDGPTRLFQNCFVIFLSITGFYLCSKYTSAKTHSKKMIGLESEKKRTNFTRLILYLICFFWIAGINACSKDAVTQPPPPPPPTDSVNIFIAGRGISASTLTSLAQVWKNGSPIALSDGTKTEIATSLFVSGNDVYVAGAEFNGPNSNSKYWKNQDAFIIGDSTSQASAITVSGSNVFVAGTGYNANRSFTIAEYWKNGIQINLTDGSSDAQATSIAVVGADVYVAGSEADKTNFISEAKYWKNGVPVTLPGGGSRSVATSICVADTNVYVAGYGDAGSNATIAKYWKNGVAVNLSDPSDLAFAYSIFVSGHDVYVAGIEAKLPSGLFTALYWKNGNPVILANGTSSGNDARSIYVFGNDVYVLGTWASMPTYWVNGNPVQLSANTNELAESIIVTRK
jgi:hypothetical protein